MLFRNGSLDKSSIREFERHQLVWGVKRRSGFSDLDDPSAHAKLTKHAFVIGDDSRALCGYRPLSLLLRRPMPLAAATEYNEPCLRCLAVIPHASKSDAPLVAIPVVSSDMPSFPIEPRVALAATSVDSPSKGRRRAARTSRRRPTRVGRAPESATS